MQTATNKIMIRGLLIGVNHSIVLALCLYLIISGQFALEERAIYASSAFLFWTGAQRIIKKALPID